MNALCRALCFLTMSVLFVGCMPAPGITQRSQQISGRVLSAATGKPVSGAVVTLHEAPQLRRATTDQSGRFTLKESLNLRLWEIYGICGATAYLHEPHIVKSVIDITHPAFHPAQIFTDYDKARSGELSHGHVFVETWDILLRPKRK